MHPGSEEKRRCSERVRAELEAFPPAFPLSLRERIRLALMANRCELCRACSVRKLVVALAPPRERGEAEIHRLAS